MNIHVTRTERTETALACHFREDAPKVLTQWVDEIEPGSTLNIVVPDTAFDERTLAEFMRLAGLIDVRHYDHKPGYLHLAGNKPQAPALVINDLRIHAVITIPRLGFNDMWMTVPEALAPLGIPLEDSRSAFWDQGMQTVIERVLAKNEMADAVMTFDYDTICTTANVAALKRIMQEHPEVDAVIPLQSNRHTDTALFAIDLPAGVESLESVPASVFNHPITRAVRGHFGCTIIRRRVFEKLPKPWFKGAPDANGGFGKGHVDPDIGFWDAFINAGLQLRLATKVRVGHLVLMIAWPNERFAPAYQTVDDYRKNGPPYVG